MIKYDTFLLIMCNLTSKMENKHWIRWGHRMLTRGGRHLYLEIHIDLALICKKMQIGQFITANLDVFKVAIVFWEPW